MIPGESGSTTTRRDFARALAASLCVHLSAWMGLAMVAEAPPVDAGGRRASGVVFVARRPAADSPAAADAPREPERQLEAVEFDDPLELTIDSLESPVWSEGASRMAPSRRKAQATIVHYERTPEFALDELILAARPAELAALEDVEPSPSPEPPSAGDPSGGPDDDELAGETEPVLLESVPPRYPPRAARRGQQGVVQCRLVVEADGRVSAVELVRSSGYAELDESALSALRRWRFRPGTVGGRAARCLVLHSVRFELE